MPCAEQHVQAVPGCRERSLACSNWVHVRSDKGRERRVVDGDAGRKAERVVGAALSKPDALNASSTAELQSRARRFADFGSEPCINSTAQEENQKKKVPKKSRISRCNLRVEAAAVERLFFFLFFFLNQDPACRGPECRERASHAWSSSLYCHHSLHCILVGIAELLSLFSLFSLFSLHFLPPSFPTTKQR